MSLTTAVAPLQKKWTEAARGQEVRAAETAAEQKRHAAWVAQEQGTPQRNGQHEAALQCYRAGSTITDLLPLNA